MESEDLPDAQGLAGVLEGEGFSPYQARAYVSLLELGSASASDLADASNVPKPRIYDVIESLDDDGYVETYQQESLHARVPSPEAVVTALRERVSELEAAVEAIEERWTRPEPPEHEVSVVSRFRTLLNRAETFVGQARHRVQLSVTPEQYRSLYSALVGAKERGVQVNVSLHSCSREAAGELPLVDATTEVRWREREAPFLAIVDNQRVCYAEHVGTRREYGVVVNDRTHASVLIWYHLSSHWELWEPIRETRGEDLPRTYLDIRRAAHELVPALREDDAPVVHVDGRDVETGRPRSFDGVIVDIAYEGESGEDGPRSLQSLAGQTSLVVETDDGTVTVGGFGAVIEDVEADRVVVEAFD